MQQEKMGCLLRELRKEKGMTQEQLAEQLGVSNRSVSRWENGINMPDISILVEISEFFEVGILELIEGERKQEEMDSNDLKKIANYSDEQKRHILNKINKKDVVGLVFIFIAAFSVSAYTEYKYNIFLLLTSFGIATAIAMQFANIAYTTGLSDKGCQFRKRHPYILYAEIVLLIILLISLAMDIRKFLAI